jgi:hypothetical protein
VSFSVPKCIPSDVQVCQAIKDVNTSASCDVLVNLLESIRTLGRLDIYTMVPPASAMTEIIVKIMLELLSALALVTKYTKLGRPSEPIPVDPSLKLTRRSGRG